jgi:Na+/melibiose symporter-like transporter
MALYAVMAMGFKKGLETTLFVVLTVPAVIGSYAIGRLVDRIGPKRSLIFTIVAWVVLLIAMVMVPTRTGFWIVGAAIGLIFRRRGNFGASVAADVGSRHRSRTLFQSDGFVVSCCRYSRTFYMGLHG